MYKELFGHFMSSQDTLRVYEGENLIYSSDKERLLPLVGYLDGPASQHKDITVFDKVIGNAAALLSVKAGAREVWSPLGSELAIKTLEKYGITYHFTETSPYITRPDGKRMCPMEELSIGKDLEEFYRALKARIESGKPADSS
jgi:hypothetical protein